MSPKVSIHEWQFDAVDNFEHQNHHQIKSNVAVTESSLAEQHLMQIIVRQKAVGGGRVLSIIKGN